MKSILLLILSNIRRRKTAFLLMGVSLFIATFLLVSAAELLANLGKAFDSMLENSRGGNLILGYNLDQYPDRDIMGWWAGRPETEGCREYPVYIAREMVFLKGEAVEGTVYVSEASGDTGGTDLLFRASRRDAPLASVPAPGEIWVSSILRYSHDLKAGDAVGVPTARGIVDFTVGAFIDDPHFNSTWGNKRFWIAPGDLYLLGSPLVYTDRLVSVRVGDPEDQERLLREFRSFLGKSFKGTVYPYGEIKNDYLMIYNIIGMVLAVVSLITIAVALIILSGNLNSFIGSEYRQMGIARALGFTSSSLVAVYVLEILILSLSFSLAAFFAGRTSAGILLESMARRSGMVFTGEEGGGVMALLYPGVNLFALVFTWAIVRRIRKVDPSKAIRFGFGSPGKKLRRPLFRMGKAGLHVPLFMAVRNLKTGSGGLFYTIFSFLLMVTLCSLSFNATSLLEESLSDRQFWGIPDAHLTFYRQGEMGDDLSDARLRSLLSENSSIRTICSGSPWIYSYIRSEGEEPFAVMGYIYSGEMADIGLINIRGEHPLNPGEISITDRLALKYGLETGDKLTLFTDGMDSEFTVSGIFQNSDNLGYSFRMLEETYIRTHPSYTPSHYFVRLDNPERAEEILNEMEGKYGMYMDGVLTSRTIREIERDFGSTMPYVKLLFAFITAVFFLISFTIIHNNTQDFILEYRRSLGILKALGISPLGLRSIGVYRILVLLGACLVVGFPLSILLSPRLLNLAFHSSGFGAFSPRPGLGDLLWIVPIITAFGFISSWVPMGQTGEIQTRELLKGE